MNYDQTIFSKLSRILSIETVFMLVILSNLEVDFQGYQSAKNPPLSYYFDLV